MDAVTRLLAATTHPAGAELVAPLVIDEIPSRLLRSPLAGRVAQIGQAESGLQRIARGRRLAARALRQATGVEELAQLVRTDHR